MMRESLLQNLSLWGCLWQSMAFITLGLVASYLLRRRPSRAYQVLLFAMMAAAVVPLMSAVVKHHDLGVFTARSPELALIMVLEEPVTDPFGHRSEMPDVAVPSTAPLTPVNPVSLETTSTQSNISWRTVAVYGWMIATLALLVRLVVTFMYGAYLVRSSHRSGCEQIRQDVDKVTLKLGLPCGLQVRANSRVRSPVVWCWSRPSVLLVPTTCRDPRADWSGVVAHELAHCKRLDHITGFIAELTVCLLPWNPLMWLSKKCLVRFGEQSCDDWVVATGQPSEDYAESLLRFRPQRQMAFLPAVVHSKRGLAGRVDRILKDSCGNPRTGVAWALAVSVVAVCVSVGVAVAQSRPEKPASATAEREDKPTKSLHRAAADGDIELVKSLISKGADVDTKDEDGWTPLHFAAYRGQKEVAEVLIAKGASISATDTSGSTPLHWAASYGGKRVPELLIANRANVNTRDNRGNTPLHIAAGVWHVDKDLLQLLLAKGADIHARNDKGQTPLHSAALGSGKRNTTHAAAFLLANGAKVNAKDNNGCTPLYLAAGTWQKEAVVELLLAKGADINEKTDDETTALHHATMRRRGDVVELLLAHGADVKATRSDGWTALHFAAVAGNRGIAELLLSKGANVNAKNEDDKTPLDIVALAGAVRIGELLIAKGADVDSLSSAVAAGDLARVQSLIKDSTAITAKNSALCAAAACGQANIAELLLSTGSSVNATLKDGKTPLHLASMGGYKDLARSLLEKGADLNARDEYRGTPLHYAAQRGHKDMAALLIAKGADVHADDRRKWRPFDYAAERGDKDTVQLLLDKGASIDVEGRYSWTPLMNAAWDGHKDLVELLIQSGADVEGPPKPDGWTPSFSAVRNSHTDILRLLLAHGADVNAKEKFGWSLLHYAASKPDITRLLLNKGALVNVRTTGSGATPLHVAAGGRHEDRDYKTVAELLISHGANVNAKDRDGKTPLILAQESGNVEIVEHLRKHGAKE